MSQILKIRPMLTEDRGAGVTTKGLYHWLAKIINASIAIEIAQFSASAEDGYNSTSTAAVINLIDGRQQVSVTK